MSLHADRPFMFRVRPRHGETLESLTRRVFAANGEPAHLQSHLLRELGLRPGDWGDVLHHKNRSVAHPAPDGGVAHRDGSTCNECADYLRSRWMCTLCAQGEAVEQHPHFRNPVCSHHQRWLGFSATVGEQHTVSRAVLQAGMGFERLRKSGRIDPRLYHLVSENLQKELGKDETTVFPTVVAIIQELTEVPLLRTLLDPNNTFSRAYRTVQKVITQHAGRKSPTTTRIVWLTMRPAFAAARQTARTGQPFDMPYSHSFPVPKSAGASIRQIQEREPFAAFLQQTGDTPETANQVLGAAYQRIVPGKQVRQHVCRNGHAFTRGSNDDKPQCPKCPRTGAAEAGINDIATLAPHLLAQWDHERNGELTPTMVAASSASRIQWKCRKGHQFQATPNNRVNNDQGCPVCLNRSIVPGINDFAARFPAKFAELAPSWVPRYKPHTHTPTSRILANWECKNGHIFKATFQERAKGRDCQDCRRMRSVALRGTLADKYPELAAEWDEVANERTAHDFSPGSKVVVGWMCARGHHYEMRVERRVAGGGCPVCANRRLLAGFNDLAALHPAVASEWHPYLNWKRANEVFPNSNAPVHWRCGAGHELKRSAVHRIASGGCTLCAREERVTVNRRALGSFRLGAGLLSS